MILKKASSYCRLNSVFHRKQNKFDSFCFLFEQGYFCDAFDGGGCVLRFDFFLSLTRCSLRCIFDICICSHSFVCLLEFVSLFACSVSFHPTRSIYSCSPVHSHRTRSPYAFSGVANFDVYGIGGSANTHKLLYLVHRAKFIDI